MPRPASIQICWYGEHFLWSVYVHLTTRATGNSRMFHVIIGFNVSCWDWPILLWRKQYERESYEWLHAIGSVIMEMVVDTVGHLSGLSRPNGSLNTCDEGCSCHATIFHEWIFWLTLCGDTIALLPNKIFTSIQKLSIGLAINNNRTLCTNLQSRFMLISSLNFDASKICAQPP